MILERAGRVEAKLRMLLLGACCFAFSAPGSAQQFNAGGHWHTRTYHRATAHMPRSSAPAGLALSKPKATSSAQQLERLEHLTASEVRSDAAVRSAATAPRIRVATSQSRSAPINFSYQGPRNGAIGHRNDAILRH